jgi:hypothetical protein
MKRRLLLFLSMVAALLLPAVVAGVVAADKNDGGDPAPPMTRIEYRLIAPTIPAESFGAKPKILYIAGSGYSRTEEQPDPAQGIHGLVICAEPDIWMVNLIPRVGQHVIDPGPTYVVHHNILSATAPKEFATLEFGKEIAFFRGHEASPLEAQVLEGQRCEVSEFRYADFRAVLYVREDTHQPFHLDVFRDARPLISVRYLSYQTGLPFDRALFKPPTGVAFKAPDEGKG